MSNSDWRHVYSEPKTSVASIETVVLTLVGVVLGYCFMPKNPYFSALGFSWVILGPFLSGLRYGFPYAISSVVLLISIGFIGTVYELPWAQGSPAGLGLVLLFTAVITGEFRNYWYRRIRRLNAAALYLHERVEEVSHAFNVLKYSHDRLEQMLASRISLRDSISSIRKQILLSHTDKESLQDFGLLILRALADVGSLQGLSLHTVNPKTKLARPHPLAYIGNLHELDAQNPLLLNAMASGKAASLKLNFVTQEDNELLLVIPLMDVYDTIFGVIAINKMPFRAYKEDNIQLLSVLGGYIGDLLSMKIQKNTAITDEEQQYFYIQSMRCMQDVVHYNLPASLLGFEFSNPLYADRLINVVTQQRGLDQLIVLKNIADNPVVLLIMPLTDQRSVEGYLLKINAHFKTEFGVMRIEELGFHYAFQVLTADKSLAASMQLIKVAPIVQTIFYLV
ncbi:MAG: GAF domain-containing protein [Methylococcales bacterium]|nr:GAF domain-containing protein [Methylococcales bacterium]